MLKIYERIDWENEPSTKTPLNEDNLNKMDYALDLIDTRVVELAGYEERAAESETNAKTSATNSANSATASQQSATNSANSANTSANSAAASQTSATNSSNSATASASSATQSANSATASQTSATQSANSATQSANSATAAKTSETEAAASKAAAKTSETKAYQSELNAKSSETKAATSAANASTYEANANEYAENAEDNAKLAKSWAVGQTGVREDENVNNAKYWSDKAQATARTTVDNVFSTTSLNPVENRVITKEHVNKSIAQENGVHGLRYYDEVLQLYDEVEQIWKDITSGGGGGLYLDEPTEVNLTNTDEGAIIKWTDPDDVVIEGQTMAKWEGTVVVRKAGSAPTKKSDGVIVVDSTTKNQYQSEGFQDTGLTNGVTYYYGIFPYTTGKLYTVTAVYEFTPSPIPPTAINDLSATSADESATLTFTKPNDATDIRLVYKKYGVPESETDGTYVVGITSPYTITGLTNDDDYYAVIYTYNEKGRSAKSNSVKLTPGAIYPAAVKNFKVTAGNECAIVTFEL